MLGGFTSRNVSSVSGSGFEDRRFARGTSSIRRRSMHVVERKVERGSDEPAGAGGGAVEREGRVDMVVVVTAWKVDRGNSVDRSDFDLICP